MMRGGMCAAALALVLICLALVSNVEAGRTHELFAQSTYDEPKTSTEENAAADVAEHVKDVEDNLPKKTTTALDTPINQPQQADTSTDNDAAHNPESARAQSTATLVDIPELPQQQKEEEQQHYRDYRGTTTSPQGDYRPDARPWWFNPQYGNYGNNIQGRNPQIDQKESNPSDQSIPNRYPMGYPTQYMGSQFYNNPSSGSQSYEAVQGSNGQYSSSMPQQQYSQNRFSQYSSMVPYEMTSGGCPTQYWISNTQRWPAFFTVKTAVGEALGTPASKVFGETTLLQALLNNRPDGYSTLLRSGATAILNSYSRAQFKFMHVNVIESFAAALSSPKAAAEQAAAYEEANISAYHEQYNSCV